MSTLYRACRPSRLLRPGRLLFVALILGSAALFAGSASAKTAYQFLQAAPKPNFRQGNTMLRLTRWGWTMSYDTRKELCENWGYALEWGGYADPTTVLRMNNANSTESKVCALTASNPTKYPLFVLTHRAPIDSTWVNAQPPETWCRTDTGAYIYDGTSKVWSPESPDSVWQSAGTVSASPLARIQQACPISMLLNGGEYAMSVYGWDGAYWAQDPRVMAAKGARTWYDYISDRKAHQEMFISNAFRAQVPNRSLYIYYWTSGIPFRMRWGGWRDWDWDYLYMRTVSDIANASIYYDSPGTDGWGWTGTYDMLTHTLNTVSQQITWYNEQLSYNWVCGGWNAGRFSDDAHYMGFLKCFYTAGMVGGVAGYFSYPTGGFEADLGTTIPSWLQQMMTLGHVQALFSHLEDYLRNGDLLPGPNVHRWSTDLPAFEFPTGDPDARVLVRKHRQRDEWLLCAWAAGGADRQVSVTVPQLGTVNLFARAVGSIYRAALTPSGPLVTLIDQDGMLPTAHIETGSLPLSAGWNLVSVPLEPLAVTTQGLLPTSKASAVWQFDTPGGYTIPAVIVPKKGYWVDATGAATLSYSGIRPAARSVTVKADWNMVGPVGPSAAQPWQPLPPNPPAIAIWQYNTPGGYAVPTRCDEGRGFWLKSSVDTDIWN